MQCARVYVYFCRWIRTPHDKIALCICDQKGWFFWFNSEPAFHGHGQLAISVGEHPAITQACFLDLSGLRAATDEELGPDTERDLISSSLRKRILGALAAPIKLLPEVHRRLALTNLA